MDGDVRHAEIEQQQEKEKGDGDPRVGGDGRENDFEDGVEGIEAVLGDL